MNHLRIIAAALGLAAAAQAQTMVEYSLGTARATAGAAGMKSAGKAAGSVFESAAKTLEKAGQAQTTASSSTVILPAAGRDAAEPVKFATPDPEQIKPGMEGEELVKKFGQPAMKISGGANSQAVETWWYGMDPNTLTVKLRDGKVLAVTPPPAQAAKKNETPGPPKQSNTGVTVLR